MAKKRKRSKSKGPIKSKAIRPKPKPKPKENARSASNTAGVTPKTKAAKPSKRGKIKSSTPTSRLQDKSKKRQAGKARPKKKIPARKPPRKRARKPPVKPPVKRKPVKRKPPVKPPVKRKPDKRKPPRRPRAPSIIKPPPRKPKRPRPIKRPKPPTPDDEDFPGEKDREGTGNGHGDVPHEFDAAEEVERALQHGFGPEDIPRLGEKGEGGKVLSYDPYYEYLAELSEMEPREIYEMFMSPDKHGIST